MIKRIISIGSIALMLLSVLVVMDIVPVTIVSATDPDEWVDGLDDGVWWTTGDWVVSLGENEVYTGPDPHTIIVRGNLTIEEGGTLTLQGVTLKMATPANGTFWITLENATNQIFRPQLIIENQGATPSIITSNITDGEHRFGFVIEEYSPIPPRTYGGTFTMRNSELRECGWDLNDTLNYKDGGLWIGSENATIQNNEIYDCYNGIVIHNAFTPTITGNNIHDNDFAGIYLRDTIAPSYVWRVQIGPGNTINNNRYWGVGMDPGWYIDIHNNTINSNGYNYRGGGVGVALLSGFVYIQDNDIEANDQFSVWGVDSYDLSIFRNSLNGSLVTNSTSFNTVAGLDMRYNSICSGGNASLYAYLAGWAVSNARLEYNYISDNVGIGAIFNICQIDVRYNTIQNNPGGGIGLQRGSWGSAIEYNKIINNDDMGMHIVGNNLDIRYNEFRNNGDGFPYSGLPLWQDCGLDVMNSDDIRVYDNDFINNRRTLPTGHVDAVYLLGDPESSTSVNQVHLWNNTMEGNNYNIHVRGWTNALVEDSVRGTFAPSPPTSYELYMEDAWLEDLALQRRGYNNVTYLNVTFEKNKVSIEDSISGWFTVQYYKHLLVEDYTGNPVSGATVHVNDTYGNPQPPSGQPYTTDSEGRITFINLTEYVEDSTGSAGRKYQTPHTIEAQEGGREARHVANMASSHYNTLVLNERPIVVSLEPRGGPIQYVYRTNTIIIEAEFEDVEDKDEENFQVYFEFRTNDTAPSWFDETSSYFGTKQSVGTGNTTIWQIEFTPPTTAPIGFYDFRVRCEDSTSGSSSDWRNSSNSVYVLNNDPTAEDILESGTTVYRGENISIFADADDIEDGDEDTFWNAELQYLVNLSSTWSSIYVSQSEYSSTAGNWKFIFSPAKSSPDPKHGPVDFQVRFQDKDGNWSAWYQEFDLIDILNNLPQFVDFDKDAGSVFRGNTIRLYTNVSDAEEAEQDLYVHFYYSKDAGPWIDDWLSTPNIQNYGQGEWDPALQRFFVEFTPPENAYTGIYEFRLYISDSDGGYITHVPGGNAINVMNNLPEALYPVSASAPEVRAGGGYVYIYINADDIENDEDQLTLRVQQRINKTANPPDIWYDTHISIETYEGTPPTGRLRANFTPSKGAQLEWYDFRAWVWDVDNGQSNYVYLFHAVEVLNPEPTLEDVTLGGSVVFRGETIEIYLNAEDLSDDESELTPEVQYLPPDGSWTDIPFSAMSYVGDVWVIDFTPADDAKVGTYNFRARVKNTANGYSEGGDWTSVTGTVEVKNNLPQADAIEAEANTVERGGLIYIYADGSDQEDGEVDLDPTFEYRLEGGQWEDEHLINQRYTGGRWRITFSPPADDEFDLGNYDFKVSFKDDDDGYSNELILSNVASMVEVTNAKPTADALDVPDREGFRLAEITITADASDPETVEGQLTPTFQYSTDGVNWIGIEDSDNFWKDTPNYVNGQWQITFLPSADADTTNKYSFRVKFSDGVDESDWLTKDNYYDLQNNEPVVTITSPIPGTQSSATVDFTASATDDEDTTLTYEWDFGDGSEFSDEEAPTHTYEKAGDYRVTVKVTDDDGGESTHYIDINIKAGAGEDEFPMLLLLLLIIIIIVVVLLLVMLLTKKKKKPEGIPPGVPGMAPAVPGAPPVAPPAAPGVAPAAPPGAPPAAIPAAIPAAVPAGPPKEAAKAGQQIKCPKCGTAFTVESAERPITIECPNCHAKGKLT